MSFKHEEHVTEADLKMARGILATGTGAYHAQAIASALAGERVKALAHLAEVERDRDEARSEVERMRALEEAVAAIDTTVAGVGLAADANNTIGLDADNAYGWGGYVWFPERDHSRSFESETLRGLLIVAANLITNPSDPEHDP